MRTRVARLRKESVTSLKAQHVMWHVTWRHLPRGHRERALSLFAENEYAARGWWACDPVGHRFTVTSATDVTWAVLSGTCGPGKLMWLEEGDQAEISGQMSHEAYRSSCHTQLSQEREGIPGESVACEPRVAEYQRSERLCVLRYHA